MRPRTCFVPDGDIELGEIVLSFNENGVLSENIEDKSATFLNAYKNSMSYSDVRKDAHPPHHSWVIVDKGAAIRGHSCRLSSNF
jgi:hypothetical protein